MAGKVLPNGKRIVENIFHEPALSYAELGLKLFPVASISSYGFKVLGCSCAAGANCSNPGKHPLFQGWGGQATDAVETVATIWPAKRTVGFTLGHVHVTPSIGLATGSGSDTWVLDMDPRHGGEESLAELERRHGALPPTPTSITGSNGKHFFFKMPTGGTLKNSAGVIAPGLDIRADGGLVVLPPSPHMSGRRYRWLVAPSEVPFAPAPGWLLALVQSHPQARAGGQLREVQRTNPASYASAIDEAVRQYNIDHSQDWPDALSRCPACGHRGCFHRMPGLDRWVCFSTNHDGCGLFGGTHWHGDALDLDAFRAGTSRTDLLTQTGYLRPKGQRPYLATILTGGE